MGSLRLDVWLQKVKVLLFVPINSRALLALIFNLVTIVVSSAPALSLDFTSSCLGAAKVSELRRLSDGADREIILAKTSSDAIACFRFETCSWRLPPLSAVAAAKIQDNLQSSCSLHGWKLDSDNNATIHNDDCAIKESSRSTTLAGIELQKAILGAKACGTGQIHQGLASSSTPDVYLLPTALAPGCLTILVDFSKARTLGLLSPTCATDNATAETVLSTFALQRESFGGSNSIGAGHDDSGYAIEIITNAGRLELTQATVAWGLNQDYVRSWLARVVEASGKTDLTLDGFSPLLKGDLQNSIGRLSLWMYSGLVQISLGADSDAFGSEAITARDWMTANIFNDPQAFEGTLLRKDIALTKR